MQQNAPVTVIRYADSPHEDHRCWCCCCNCFHIKNACILLLVLCLFGVASQLFNSAKILGAYGDGLPPGLAGMQALTIIGSIFLVISSILCFVAIFNVRPKLVLPHIAALGFACLVGIINAIIVVAVVAGSSNDWFFGRSSGSADDTSDYKLRLSDDSAAYLDIIRKDDDMKKHMKHIFIGTYSTAVIVGSLISIAFSIWFIYLFFQLKKYLEDVQQGGTAFNMQPKMMENQQQAPPPQQPGYVVPGAPPSSAYADAPPAYNYEHKQ